MNETTELQDCLSALERELAALDERRGCLLREIEVARQTLSQTRPQPHPKSRQTNLRIAG
jgi:predicted  nucleic acid-binding Zn-ribbon protein